MYSRAVKFRIPDDIVAEFEVEMAQDEDDDGDGAYEDGQDNDDIMNTIDLILDEELQVSLGNITLKRHFYTLKIDSVKNSFRRRSSCMNHRL